ncbi:hypothetical protein GORBP_055_00050 [Gordonia rubripertincta NBRC 101908]|uniref:Uncharacterized protein n=1 Tax=Gordonia rubripertincta NBRC 101908 TaxID=1077975 RepID=A0ABQ0HSE5_GORRU|nr:hypothetical protein GORBP_055_00050 [Gordonia rubripertincta NBRC 101908]
MDTVGFLRGSVIGADGGAGSGAVFRTAGPDVFMALRVAEHLLFPPSLERRKCRGGTSGTDVPPDFWESAGPVGRATSSNAKAWIGCGPAVGVVDEEVPETRCVGEELVDRGPGVRRA